jgi:uncharacterized protein
MSNSRQNWRALLVLAAVTCSACRYGAASSQQKVAIESDQITQVVEAAVEQSKYTTGYDPSYAKLDYPGGDVPIETGVCADVIIRAFRKGGIDLQKEIHEDMGRGFSEYPQLWGAKRPDRNIDHRRVPNLMAFFKRKGKELLITKSPSDYQPGDIVAWDLGNGQTHIGMMTNMLSSRAGQLMIVHNIGAGTRVEDVLFNWKIIGHYRFFS